MSALRALRPPVPRLVLFAVTLALASLGCGVTVPRVVIVSPLNGTFTSATAVVVSGLLLEVDPDSVADVLVNGVSVLPLGPSQSFQTTLTLDPRTTHWT